MPSLTTESPFGPLTITEEDDFIVSLRYGGGGKGDATPLLRRAEAQLAEYFAHKRTSFDLPLRPQGNAFQLALWRLMEAIPYGEVRTYGSLATELGSMPQEVGVGCGSNPLPIFIPCHRVVASNALGGYSGGQGRITKQKLLALEQRDLFRLTPPP